MRSRCFPKTSSLIRTLLARGASEPIVHSPFPSIAAAVVATAGLAIGLLLARGPLLAAMHALGGQRLGPLIVAGACAPLVPATTAAAWRSVLASNGEALTARQAWGCYGLGSLANTILPGRLGEAVRIEAFSRRLGHVRRRWLAGGVSATVALGQSVVLSLVLTFGAIGGSLPLWAIAPSVALPAVLWGGATVALRRRPHGRLACLATAKTMPLSAWVRLLGWISVGALARLVLAAAVLAALSVAHPFADAVVVIGSLAVGNILPFAPGAAGVPAAAIAVGLSRAGIDSGTAVAAALSFHVFETGAALLFAATGWLGLKLAARDLSRDSSSTDSQPDRNLVGTVAAGVS